MVGQVIFVLFAILYALFWIVLFTGMVSPRFKSWVIQHISPVQQRLRRKMADPQVQKAGHIIKESVWRLTEESWDIWADAFESSFWPVILAMVFTRMQPIVESWIAAPQKFDFMQAVGVDVNANQVFWSVVIAAFIMWFMIRMVRMAKDHEWRLESTKTNKEILEKLSHISKQLDEMNQKEQRG